MSAIPDKVRGLVKVRDRFLCVRCRTAGAALHHRRSRAVPGEHQHCTCNLVLLCHECHRWAHAQPFLARADGIIISKYKDDLDKEPLTTPFGVITLDCMGGFLFV